MSCGLLEGCSEGEMGLGGETHLRSCRLPGGQLLISMLTHYRMMNMLLLFIHKECLFFFFFNLQLRCNFLPPLKALNCYCPKVLFFAALLIRQPPHGNQETPWAGRIVLRAHQDQILPMSRENRSKAGDRALPMARVVRWCHT